MAVPVQMPKQGNTVEECLLVEWRVKEGDAVKAGDILCAIETDKASFEVESPAAGTVLALFRPVGELVKVLTNIAAIGNPGEDVSALAPEGVAPAPAPAKTESPSPANVQTPTQAAAPATREAPTPAFAPSAPTPSPTGKAAVSPRARKTAERLGVDAARLAGSGPGGRVVEADVMKAADAGARLTPAASAEIAATGKPAPAGGGTGIGGQIRLRDLSAPAKAAVAAPAETPAEVPYKGIRKLIGDRMRQSLAQHAQLTLNSSADATQLMAFRQAVKADGKALGLPNVTLNDLVCWVVAQTLPRFPEVNAVFDIKGEKLVPSRRAHLAVAVDTPRGLMVPVIQDADRLSLAELSGTIARYAEECRQGKINPDLLAGGTFTVTNLGSLGVETFTPILNAPQVAILGVCAIRDVAQPDGSGGVRFRPRMGLSLTIDHQVVDGAPGARLLQAVATGIENVQATLSLWGAAAR